MMNFSKLIKKAFNLVGLDIVRLSRNPQQSLLGLKRISIKSILDIGANEGQFAKYITKLFPKAHIYCFEPLPEPFVKLNTWAKKQNKKKSVFNLAMGDKESTLEMFSHVHHSPSSSLLKTTKFCETYYPFTQNQTVVPIKVTTLDKWSKDYADSFVPEILIKLDVQGYEDRVIRGGREIFGNAKACILEICLDQLYEDQATYKDICMLLYSLGYFYAGNLDQIYADDGHVIYIDAVFVK